MSINISSINVYVLSIMRAFFFLSFYSVVISKAFVCQAIPFHSTEGPIPFSLNLVFLIHFFLFPSLLVLQLVVWYFLRSSHGNDRRYCLLPIFMWHLPMPVNFTKNHYGLSYIRSVCTTLNLMPFVCVFVFCFVLCLHRCNRPQKLISQPKVTFLEWGRAKIESRMNDRTDI